MGRIQHLGNPKISQLDPIILDTLIPLKEEVLGFEIPMQYLLIMEIVNSKCDLCDPVEYLGLREVLPLFLHLLDLRVHVAQLAIHHDYTQVTLLIREGILIRYDVDMPQFLKDLKLIFYIFAFLLVDLEDLNTFERVVVVLVCDVLAEKHVAR